jgi:phosphatidylglycerophosphatase A
MIRHAPGTFSSLVTLLIWILFIPGDYFIRISITFLLTIIGFIFIKLSLPNFKENDPQSIVIDEVIGMSVALIFINDLSIMIIAFLLFRMLDILKPSIIYYSQYLPGAYGILLDDILAGAITSMLLIAYI